MQEPFTTIWAFDVPAESEAEFRSHYGPQGTWAALFELAPGYVETLLLHDQSQPGRFLTVDRWQDAAAYRAFRDRFADPYAELDRICAHLTRAEMLLGSFTECA
jgi:heme-degrading monooxygenase HmoA